MNESKANKTVLVTGANSGVGFEAAAQLAESGWGTVILACRTEEKARAAAADLTQRVGKDVFATLAIDTSEVASAHGAADELVARGAAIDGLVLNAGASGSQATYNSDGVEMTWASTLLGHHVLTMKLWQAGLLGAHARIIIAGSEGARGNLPGSPVHPIEEISDTRFDGDMAEAIVQLSKTKVQDRFVNMSEYVTAKLVVAWWAAALAHELPAGMTVNAVSPGSAPNSNFARAGGLSMKLMMGMMKVFGPMMGMAGTLEAAGRRYVDALELGDDDSGHFYATAHPKKLVGPVARQETPKFFADRKGHAAALEAMVRITKVGLPEQGAAAAQ
ncbi:MAG: SDR family NAD(P)-dependent oxidoreductase [Nannocystaceae bacterium]|nr:SDR family NAD(P)-dependent oxidoreductase [Nannocystaceae bacterium]